MAGIDWGQLGGISAPRVMGSVPASPDASGNSMNSLIGGISQGMQEARQGQLAQQQIQESQTRNAYNQILLQQAQKNQTYQNNLSNAYKQNGIKGYYDALTPDDKLKYDGAMANVQKAQADIAKDLSGIQSDKANTLKTNLSNTDGAALLISRTFNTADQVSKNSQGKVSPEQAYQSQLATMPDDVRSHMPAHYSPTMSLVAHQMGVDTLQKMSDVAGAKNTGNGKGDDDKSSFGKTFGTDSAEQKAVADAETNSRSIVQGLRTANTLGGELNSIPDNAFNPTTGAVDAKYTAKGEAITKEINTLVTQAPSVLGLPASALRSATVWNMIKDSKPSAKMWAVADKAMIDNIKYMGALQYYDNWKTMAAARQAQLISGDSKGQAEAKDWLARNKDPLKENPMPDLTNFYKLFPNMKGQLEQDWKTIQSNKLPGMEKSPSATTSQQQQFQEGQVYKDAKGNQAKYVNGQWQPL